MTTPFPDQPPDSKITFLPTPASLTFIVPRTGFRRAAGGILFFSFIWNTVTWMVFIPFILVFVHQPSFTTFWPLLFILLFVSLGLVTLLASFQLAFRKAVILATRDSLVYTQTGPIRNLEFQWKPDEIATIRTDFSGTTVRNVALRELQIISKAGKKRRFFDGRDDGELEWLAGTLNDFYNRQPS